MGECTLIIFLDNIEVPLPFRTTVVECRSEGLVPGSLGRREAGSVVPGSCLGGWLVVGKQGISISSVRCFKI